MPRRQARRRNTAPMWKKLTIVASAVLAAVVVMSFLSDSKVNFLVAAVAVFAVVAAVVWMVARLLGVHLGLSSWD